MGLDDDEAKLQVEEIFGSRVKTCAFERSFVLRVEFENETDVGSVFTRCPYQKTLHSGSLFSLSTEVPLVVFDNATLNRTANAPISVRRNADRILQQDPFHYDYEGEKASDQLKSTFLFNPQNITRQAPTYFALPEQVKLAVNGMEPLSVSDTVRNALLEMGNEDYGFSLRPRERPYREAIITGFPEFTDEVFAQIDPDAKYAHQWTQNDCSVTMHINDGTKLLHARGSSETDQTNDIAICDFYPE